MKLWLYVFNAMSLSIFVCLISHKVPDPLSALTLLGDSKASGL